ncbi:MAG: hypothetical protein JWN59_1466 [Sphingomonas bacterium]|nr:hypothetical protein [Sphingomonas bacterium]
MKFGTVECRCFYTLEDSAVGSTTLSGRAFDQDASPAKKVAAGRSGLHHRGSPPPALEEDRYHAAADTSDGAA